MKQCVMEFPCAMMLRDRIHDIHSFVVFHDETLWYDHTTKENGGKEENSMTKHLMNLSINGHNYLQMLTPNKCISNTVLWNIPHIAYHFSRQIPKMPPLYWLWKI